MESMSDMVPLFSADDWEVLEKIIDEFPAGTTGYEDYHNEYEEKPDGDLPAPPNFSILLHPHAAAGDTRSVPKFVEEEELEWISNKDAFPMVESLDEIMPYGHQCFGSSSTDDHLSPISVLDYCLNTANGNGRSNGVTKSGGPNAAILSLCGIVKVPGRARSKVPRKKRVDALPSLWQAPIEKTIKVTKPRRPSSTNGRKCQHCLSETTPQWRAGPTGPKTLCNACGVRYKSGRLLPEYRPANSPTFSSELHSNSHRKIIEMRKRKQTADTCESMASKLGGLGAGWFGEVRG